MKTATIDIEDLLIIQQRGRIHPDAPSLYSDQTAFFVKSDFQF